MKKILSLVLLFLLSSFFIAPCHSKTIKVKENTPVEITITQIVSSKDAVVGQEIPIKINKDVIIDDIKIFAQGTNGIVTINQVTKRGFWGKGGAIVLNSGKVYDINGNEHKIAISKSFLGKEIIWANLIASFGIATVILCPLGLFAFVKGEDAQTQIDVSIEAILLNEFKFQTK